MAGAANDLTRGAGCRPHHEGGGGHGRCTAAQRVPTLSSSMAVKLIEWAAARGLDARELYQRAGLAPQGGEATPHARVPGALYFEIWEEVMRALRDPALPIAFATTVRLEDYHLLGFLALTSADGRAALHRLSRYLGLLTEAGEWVLEDRGRAIAARWFRRDVDFSLGHRVGNECAVAQLIHVLRQLRRGDLTPAAVSFRHPEPPDASAHRRFFRCPIQFGAASDGFTLDAALLGFAPVLANQALNGLLEGYAEELLARSPRGGLPDRVREAVLRALPDGAPRLPRIARQLGMSERNLRRALEAEGITFRDLVDQIRRAQAEELLRSHAASSHEIALLLGFSEASAFSRAFKRWHGKSPRDFLAGDRGGSRSS